MLIARRVFAACLLLTTSAPAVAQPCSDTFDVPDASYYQLAQAWPGQAGLANAFVWIDDINSGIFGGYRSFNVYVIVGKNYPPFTAPAGKLNRNDFEAVKGYRNANNTFIPWAIAPETPAQRAFTVAERQYVLTLVQVRNAYLSENDSIRLKVCSGPRSDKIAIEANLSGLPAGAAIDLNIHEGTSCDKPGNHLNPDKTKHGRPTDRDHHAGDLGQIRPSTAGRATLKLTVDGLALSNQEPTGILGKTVVVSSNSRVIACGVILPPFGPPPGSLPPGAIIPDPTTASAALRDMKNQSIGEVTFEKLSK